MMVEDTAASTAVAAAAAAEAEADILKLHEGSLTELVIICAMLQRIPC